MESNEVAVPVIVLDKERLDEIHGLGSSVFNDQGTAQFLKLIDTLTVRGLSASDFQVFEDGAQYKIDHVSFESGANASAQRKWVHQNDLLINVNSILPGYLLSYVPPSSALGSCHNVQVKVSRTGVLVYWQHQYCNRADWVDDPLRGTQLGNEMLKDLASGKAGKIKLSATTFSFLGGNETNTEIMLGFPSTSQWLKNCRNPPQIGFSGVAYNSGGAVVARFSGLLYTDSKWRSDAAAVLALANSTSCEVHNLTHYETQMRLPPGEYELNVVMRDGSKFGRVEIPVTVQEPDPKHLTISDITLATKYRQVTGGDVNKRYEPLVSKGFEVIPTADTRFKKGGPFYFYLQVYNPDGSGISATNIEVHLRIVDPKTSQVVKNLEPASAASYAKPGDPVIPIGGGIDISALPSGSYLLEAQATDSVGDSTPWMHVAFSIE